MKCAVWWKRVARALKKIDPAPLRVGNGPLWTAETQYNNIALLIHHFCLRVAQSDQHPTNVCGGQSCCCCYKSLGGRPSYVLSSIYIYVSADKVERRTSAVCEISSGKSERPDSELVSARPGKWWKTFAPAAGACKLQKFAPGRTQSQLLRRRSLMVMSIVNHLKTFTQKNSVLPLN